MKPRLYLVVSTLFFLSAAGAFAQAQDSKPATVVGITGKWKLINVVTGDCSPPQDRSKKDLHFLDCVVEKDFCAQGAEGSLVMLFGNEAHSYPCDRLADDSCAPDRKDGFRCARHIVAPTPPTNIIKRTLQGVISAGQSLSAAVSPLFRESPTAYITPISRGFESQMTDSVVALAGDRVDLAPAFQEMDPGIYRLRLESLSGSARASAPIQLLWSGSRPATVPAAGIQPGLYRLVRLTGIGEPAGQNAWVLVSGPDRFAKDSASFQSAVEATKKWPDDVDARAPRAILRAYLDSLSRQAVKAQ